MTDKEIVDNLEMLVLNDTTAGIPMDELLAFLTELVDARDVLGEGLLREDDGA